MLHTFITKLNDLTTLVQGTAQCSIAAVGPTMFGRTKEYKLKLNGRPTYANIEKIHQKSDWNMADGIPYIHVYVIHERGVRLREHHPVYDVQRMMSNILSDVLFESG